jgi:hypothetical protein
MTITGTTWLDFLICVGFLGAFSTIGFVIGRFSKMIALTEALDMMRAQYEREAREHYHSRMRIAHHLEAIKNQARDKSGQLPDEYTD